MEGSRTAEPGCDEGHGPKAPLRFRRPRAQILDAWLRAYLPTNRESENLQHVGRSALASTQLGIRVREEVRSSPGRNEKAVPETKAPLPGTDRVETPSTRRLTPGRGLLILTSRLCIQTLEERWPTRCRW